MSVRPAPGATGAPPQWTGATGATGATGMGGMGGLGAARLAAVLAAGQAQEEATGAPKGNQVPSNGNPKLSKGGPLSTSFRRASTGKNKPATAAEVALAESTKKGGAAAPDPSAIPDEPEDPPLSPKSRRDTRGKLKAPEQSDGMSEVDSYNKLKAEGIKTAQKELGGTIKANKFGKTLKAKADETRADLKQKMAEGKYDFLTASNGLPSLKTAMDAAIKAKRQELRDARDEDRKCEDKRAAAADAVSNEIEERYKEIVRKLSEALALKNQLLNESQEKNQAGEKNLTEIKELQARIDQMTEAHRAALDSARDQGAAELASEKARLDAKMLELRDENTMQQKELAKLRQDITKDNLSAQAKRDEIAALRSFIDKQKADRAAMYKKVCDDLMASLKNADAPK